MSIRAYRVKRIDLAKAPSFNLWHDDKLVDFLGRGGWIDGIGGNGGLISIPSEVLEQAIETLPLDEDIVQSLRADIEASKAKGEDWVEYYCS